MSSNIHHQQHSYQGYKTPQQAPQIQVINHFHTNNIIYNQMIIGSKSMKTSHETFVDYGNLPKNSNQTIH